ncbi:MAG: radical SAM protein [Spirochaetes bacterium]|nr:radical SAM protein [Spirochaetota bacterium]
MKNLIILINNLNYDFFCIFEELVKYKYNNLIKSISFNQILLFLPDNSNDNYEKKYKNIFLINQNILTFKYNNLISFFQLLKNYYDSYEDKEDIFFLIYQPEYIFFDLDINKKILEESEKIDIQYYYGEGFPEGVVGQVFKYEIIEDILAIIKQKDEIKKNFIFDILLRNITNFDIELIEGNENFEAFRSSFCINKKEDIPPIIRILFIAFSLLIYDKELFLLLCKEDFFKDFIEFRDYSDYYNNIFYKEKLLNSSKFKEKYNFDEISKIATESLDFFDISRNFNENVNKFREFISDKIKFRSFEADIIDVGIEENLQDIFKTFFNNPYFFLDNILRIFPEIVFSYPKTVVLEISSVCSFSCISCPYTYGKLKRKKEFLTLDNIKELYEKNIDYFKDVIFIIGGFGEPFENQEAFDIINYLSQNNKVYVETNCSKFTSDITKKLTKFENVYFVLNLDAYSSDTYIKLGKKMNFNKLETFCKYYLEKYPDNFFIQFIRMKENDDELELFYEKWKKFEDNIIFRKYNNFSLALEDRDVVDLTPVVRYPCFHIRRDLYIMSDGSISLCKSDFNSELIKFNIFENNFLLSPVFNNIFCYYKDHCFGNFPEICKNCNEFYTFYF